MPPRSVIRVKYQTAPFGEHRPWFAIVIEGMKATLKERWKAVRLVMRLLSKKYGREKVRFLRHR